MKRNNPAQEQVFEDIKREVLKIDPVYFASEYLTIDGKPLMDYERL